MPVQGEMGGGDQYPQGYDPASRPNPIQHEFDSPTDRLSETEGVSGGILPTPVSVALSEARLTQRERKRAARLLAGWLDVPPSQILRPVGFHSNNVGSVMDPITGRPISFSSAKRLLKPYEGMYYRQLLRTIPAHQDKGDHIAVNGAKINPDKVAEVVKALQPIDGNALPFESALGMAVSVAQTLNPTQISAFRDNISLVSKAAPGDLPISKQVALAHYAAMANYTFQDGGDVLLWLATQDPRVKKDMKKGGQSEAYQGVAAAVTEARAQIEQWKQYRQDKKTATLIKRTEGPGALVGTQFEQGVNHKPDSFIDNEQADLVLRLLNGQDSVRGHYSETVKSIISQVTLKDYQHDNSILGTVENSAGWGFSRVGDIYNFISDKVGSGLTLAGSGFGGLIALAAGTPKEAVLSELESRMRDATLIYHGRKDLSWELEKNGVPSWMATTMELGVQFATDPLILGGRAMRLTHENRFLGAYGGRTEQWAQKVNKWLDKPLGRFGTGQTPAKTLFDAARKAGDDLSVYDRVTARFRAYYDVDGISPQFADWAYRWTNYATDTLKLSEKEVVEGLRDMWAVNLGATPLKGSWAEKMMQDLNKARPIRQGKAPPSLAPHWTERIEANAAEEILQDAMDGVTFGTTQRHFLPYFGGPGKDARAVFENFAGDTRFGRALRALGNKVPGNVSQLEHKLGDWVEQWATRSREFSRKEIAEYRHQALRVSNPNTINRGSQYVKLLQDMHDEAVKRMAARLGYDHETAVDVLKNMERETRNLNAHLFGVFPGDIKAGANAYGFEELSKARKPLFETQEVNQWVLSDPVRVRQILQDGIGAVRSVRAASMRVFGDRVPAAKLVKHASGWGIIRDSKIAAQDWFLRYWKRAVVAVPRYVLRVPLGDEQLRKLADIGLIGSIQAGKSYDRIATALGHAQPTVTVDVTANTVKQVRSDVLRAGFSGPDHAAREILAERAFPGTDPVRASLIEALPPDTKRLIDKTLDEIAAGRKPTTLQLELVTPRPGALADEAGANSGFTHSEFFESTRNERTRLLKAVRANIRDDVKSFGEVLPSQGEHLATWDHHLRNTIGRSNLGRRVLRGIMEGRTPKQMRAEIANMLKKNSVLRSRIGLLKGDAAAIEEHADRVVHDVWYATMGGDKELADMAFHNDQNLITRLSQSKMEDRPVVNGFKSDILGGRPNPIARGWQAYERAILELPTNKLSRQPYYKAWHTQMRNVLIENAKTMGVKFDTEVMRRIEAESRAFALDRVKRIMFDFRSQGRLGELLRFTAPFFQPYLEAFQVWGHLIAQNPAIAGYIMQVHDAGLRTGFIRKDPISGEERIPLTWWLGGGAMLDMAFGGGSKDMPGWTLSAPLSSLNFFFNSTFPVPIGGDKHVGIPFPSFSPPVAWLMQKFEESSLAPSFLKKEMTSFLTQFGPTTGLTLLPPYIQRTMEGLGWINKESVNSAAIDFLRMYEARGLTAQAVAHDEGITVGAAEKKLKKMAQKQAHDLSFFRAFFSMFFPTSPTVYNPITEKENLLRQYIDKYNDLDKGTEAFLKDNPDNPMVTISSTFWSRPGSPVPIPANELADKILTDPKNANFVKRYPRWSWALLTADAWQQPSDRQVFFRQVDAHYRTTKDPSLFYKDFDRQQGWEAWRAIRDHWDAVQHGLEDQGFSENTVTWKAAKSDYDNAVVAVKEVYPGFAHDIDTFEKQGIDPKVIQEAHNILNVPAFAKTEVGKGLKAYLNLREALWTRMAAKNITSLTTKTAEDLGITKDYNDGVQAIIKENPLFERAYQYFFQGDLQNVVTKGDLLVDSLSTEQKANFYDFEQHWGDLQDQAFQSSNSAEASLNYINQRDMANSVMSLHGKSKNNPLWVWWNTQTVPQQNQYRDGVMARPYIFLSRFDREVVLKEPTSDSAEQKWIEVGKVSAEISRLRYEVPAASLTPFYEKQDALVQQYMAQDPVFAKQVEHANTWGYGFRTATNYADRPGPEGEAWKTFYASLDNMQKSVEQHELHGGSDPNPLTSALYADTRRIFTEYIDKLKEYSPGFNRTWSSLDQENGPTPLVDLFFPDTWYRLGG